MYDSFGYGQPMMQQMRQSDWQQRMMARNAPRYEVIQVNGENGARSFSMAPNSSALLMDTTAPIVWLCTTDGAGYLTASAFDITPHQAEKPLDVRTLEERIERLEAKINEQSDAAPAKRRAARQSDNADAE